MGEVSQKDAVLQREPIISEMTEDGKVKVNLKERNLVLEQAIESMLKQPELGGLWTCSACGKTNSKKGVLKNHIETHIDGFVHMCPHCGKKFGSSNALQFHVYMFHKKGSNSDHIATSA